MAFLHAGIARSARNGLSLGLLAMIGAWLGGCGLPGGNTSIGTTTFGTGSQQYAFARARVPVVVEGTSTPTSRGQLLKASMTIGEAKYVVDGAVSVRIAASSSDRFKARVDERYLLQDVVSVKESGAGDGARAGVRGIADFPALLTKALPTVGRIVTIERVSRQRLEPFRIEKELDPGAPEEIQAMRGELERVAKGWGLSFAFAPVPQEVEVAQKRILLMPNRSATCQGPVCFRLPVAYRMRLEPTIEGWKGSAQTHVWLANDGPIAGLDVRHAAFGDGGVKARFQNGMLMSIVAARPGLAEQLIVAPPTVTSSALVTSSVR